VVCHFASKLVPAALDVLVQLDSAAHRTYGEQLYRQLRDAALSGRLQPGARLPASRRLASTLGVARQTVLDTYEQLAAEGYLVGRHGSGTFVAEVLPDHLLRVRGQTVSQASQEGRVHRGISKRGALLSSSQVIPMPLRTPLRAFRIGHPAVDAFPFQRWRRLADRRWRSPPRDLTGYGYPGGYPPLREAIAGYLGAVRAVYCAPEQVIVLGGSQQALDLAARVLLDPGDTVWFEEPGYLGARAALAGAGARIIPIPVDQDGLEVAVGTVAAPAARLAYVTPSHQYPLGVTLSLARRLALLAWAARADAWILEDDHDSEFRYAGRPLAALQGLDTSARVIYIGTFSKTLLPSLRLGYLVVPPDLVDAFTSARAVGDRQSPSLEQAVLADFIAEGHFGRHIRRMRQLYAERQQLLIEAASRELLGVLELRPESAGLHLVGRLPASADDRALSRAAYARGVDAIPLSATYLGPPNASGLLLGYAAYPEAEIRAGMRELAQALVAGLER